MATAVDLARGGTTRNRETASGLLDTRHDPTNFDETALVSPKLRQLQESLGRWTIVARASKSNDERQIGSVNLSTMIIERRDEISTGRKMRFDTF